MPPNGSRLFGHIKSYNSSHGYGFIKCPEIWQADVHFSRSLLPPEAQDVHGNVLTGIPVEFELLVNRDGKLRSERVWFLEPLPDRPRMDHGGEFRKGSGKGSHDRRREDRAPRDRDRERDGPPPPDLDEATVQQMTQLLEEKGGSMDHGKFANAFPGVKKSQLEPHFVLVPEDSSHSGGRWQVLLPGVEPLTAEERAARDEQERIEAEAAAAEAGETTTPPPPPPPTKPASKPAEPPEELLALEPSSTLRLIGYVKKWDRQRGYGFVEADGVDDVFLHRNDLPPEVRSWRGNFEGVEVTFVLDAPEDGKLKAVDVHILLIPDNEGRWQLRRVVTSEEGQAGAGAEPDGRALEEEEEVVEEDDAAAAGNAATAGDGGAYVQE